MTAPHDRISYGSHVFPFAGLRTAALEPSPLPLIPIRVRAEARPWSTPFDAALDTGSTRTFLPKGLAEANRIVASGDPEEIEGAASAFEARPADADLMITDANYPEVPVWEIRRLRLWIPVREDAVAIPVLGWDLLAQFHICFDHRRQKVEMRLQTP